MANVKKTILVVDDHKFLRNFWESKLSANDYNIRKASDGLEAIKIARVEPLDIILLDIVMPHMNGFETLKNLKADEKIKDIPVIVLSNLGTDEEIKQGMKLGAIDYIVKSDVIPSEVEQKIKKYLKN
ncbi:response regulator [Patescibacteria group bacterium]|nr:response regulator [Patescibacteria group bacterium]